MDSKETLEMLASEDMLEMMNTLASKETLEMMDTLASKKTQGTFYKKSFFSVSVFLEFLNYYLKLY
jgi:hypothetical protein